MIITRLDAGPPPEPSDPAKIPITATPGYYSEFPELWMNKHQVLVRQVAKRKGPLDLLLLGDSITALWGQGALDRDAEHAAVWSRYFGGYSYLNLGIGGDTTQSVLWRIQHGELDGLTPRVVVLAIGVNNLDELAVPRAAIAAGVEKCVESIRAKLPETEVIVVDIFPHEESPSHLARQRGEEARKAVRALGLGRRPRVHELDLAGRFLEPDGALKLALFQPDRIHLTTAGYEVYAEGLAPLVKQLLPPP